MPTIDFKADGRLELRGKSVPEDANAYYKQANVWLETYLSNPAPNTTFSIKLEYYNTITARCLLEMFHLMREAQNAGKTQVGVEWYYEEGDEEMMEAGHDFEDMAKLSFKVIELRLEE